LTNLKTGLWNERKKKGEAVNFGGKKEKKRRRRSRMSSKEGGRKGKEERSHRCRIDQLRGTEIAAGKK